MEKRLKIRISYGPNTAMGPGKADLLEAIIECGSISKAAQKMNMSYRRAWELVNVMNESFISPIIITSHGGSHGGGAFLSDLGLNILQSYRLLEKNMTLSVKKELDYLFNQLK
ncbi:MAG: ModE family transcriptional regulator [Ferrovum sp. 37-45-19]|jgi:molybdate transport system regulatory protein|uniref:winged helix-turn-helix domain-containing protein n=1 Tax=Ferrovum sp. JA12 TaxID=1356299 RepID=UPI000702B713|nr:LysR family transcriptional regulator [Ferrovum sp. JA12]OYV78717.1 MAG: ModE family transcriptional regulator [Ferrovum sp. 21-44-67]OYV93365.1 MAG: ModE family transcriptional regulator [Ferrovum sp. 37-45-19]OZB32117.1 MAG: ModE family transcriptional regulator [Ferrovum sp. 34-44-207]HQT82274.1 LysR family transcriptional regulator [Ferrovaceae bacterium]KRH79105.1 molybdenum-pterin-binding protein MopA [Ferrovum sp. JA12]